LLGSIAAALDRLAHGSHREPRDERGLGLVARGEGVAYEEHVGARLERHEVARGVQAPRRVVVPVIILFVGSLLLVGELRLGGREAVGGLADEGERPRAGSSLPEHRRDGQGTPGDDVHSSCLSQPRGRMPLQVDLLHRPGRPADRALRLGARVQ